MVTGIRDTYNLIRGVEHGGELPIAQDGTTNLGFNYNRAIRCGPGATCGKMGNPFAIVPSVSANYDFNNNQVNTDYGLGFRYNPLPEVGDFETQLMFNRANSFIPNTEDLLTSAGDASLSPYAIKLSFINSSIFEIFGVSLVSG